MCFFPADAFLCLCHSFFLRRSFILGFFGGFFLHWDASRWHSYISQSSSGNLWCLLLYFFYVGDFLKSGCLVPIEWKDVLLCLFFFLSFDKTADCGHVWRVWQDKWTLKGQRSSSGKLKISQVPLRVWFLSWCSSGNALRSSYCWMQMWEWGRKGWFKFFFL